MQFPLIVTYPIRRKNVLWTRSSDSTSHVYAGFHRTEGNSRIGLTSEVYKVIRQISLLNYFVYEL
jgi:hypothetical protein